MNNNPSLLFFFGQPASMPVANMHGAWISAWLLPDMWWHDMAVYLACRGYSTFREWHRDVLGAAYPPVDVRCFASRTGLSVGRFCRNGAFGWKYTATSSEGVRLLRRWNAHDSGTVLRRNGTSSFLFVTFDRTPHSTRCCYGLFFDLYANSAPPRDTWLFDPDMLVLHKSSRVEDDVYRMVIGNCHAWFDCRNNASQLECIRHAHDVWRRRGGVMHDRRCRVAWIHAKVIRHRLSFLTLLRRWKKRSVDFRRLCSISPRHAVRGISHTEIVARLRGHPSGGMHSVINDR